MRYNNEISIRQKVLAQCCSNVSPALETVGQQLSSTRRQIDVVKTCFGEDVVQLQIDDITTSYQSHYNDAARRSARLEKLVRLI